MLSTVNASGGHGGLDWESKILWRNDLEAAPSTTSEMCIRKGAGSKSGQSLVYKMKQPAFLGEAPGLAGPASKAFKAEFKLTALTRIRH